MHVTTKLINTFYAAKTKGLSANEAYNVDVLHITTERFVALKNAHDATFGCCGGRLTVKQAKFAIGNW